MKFNKVIRVNPMTNKMAKNFTKTLEQNKRETEKKEKKEDSKSF
jgi:hypothetical protein